MTVNEMIERLEEVAESGFGACELRLAFQFARPEWALQYKIGGIAVPDDKPRGMAEFDEGAHHATSAVYIVDGEYPDDDKPYAPPWAFAAAR